MCVFQEEEGRSFWNLAVGIVYGQRKSLQREKGKGVGDQAGLKQKLRLRQKAA